jgi:hypothetical protein
MSGMNRGNLPDMTIESFIPNEAGAMLMEKDGSAFVLDFAQDIRHGAMGGEEC